VEVDTTVTIARPPSEVFDYVADIRNDPSWHTDVIEVRSSTDVVGPGTVFEVKVKPSMGVSEGTMTVRRFEPGRLVEFEGRMGTMAPTVVQMCEAAGEGTRLTRRVQLEPSGMMRAMTPMIRRKIAKDNTRFLAHLKSVLERPGS
jgi:uncharacterized protein YndB with AHSA1/START domain